MELSRFFDWRKPYFPVKNFQGIYEVPDYNHLDFVTATDNAENVFHRIISVVRKQEEEMCGQ